MANADGSFQAFGFHPDFGNGAIEGTLLFANFSITFRSNEARFDIPIRQLVATMEEGEEGRIVFRDSQRPDLCITTDDMGVLDWTSIPAIARLNEEITARLTRREMSRRIRMVVWFFAGSCGRRRVCSGSFTS